MLKEKLPTMATIEILVTFLAFSRMAVRLCSGFSTITNDRQER